MHSSPSTTQPPSSEAMAPGATSRRGKAFQRRRQIDKSQKMRILVQFAFLFLNAWIGLEFLIWVRAYEGHGTVAGVTRPAGVDGWLPIAGLMNLKLFALTGQVPAIHPASMFLLVIFLLVSLLCKKAFCSWLCPIGSVSEYLWKLGRKLVGRNFEIPRKLDIGLRALKYVLLSFFLFIVASLTAEALAAFMQAPFGIIADVKMLNFFRYMGIAGFTVIALLTVSSLFIQNFWCRYLCPYGALMGIVSIFSPAKIRRDEDACISCAKCAKACPSHLPVDKLLQIRSVECTACMECVAVCPAESALQFSLQPRASKNSDELAPDQRVSQRWAGRTLQPGLMVAVLAILFFGLIGVAEITGHWQTPVSRQVYQRLVPHANEFSH